MIALYGPIGAGKTTFAKALANALGVADEVTSPSYTLINEYPAPLPLFHVDLYRLEANTEIAALGLEEYFDDGGITVVEWAERAEHVLPARTISVRIGVENEGSRTVTVTQSGTESGESGT